MTMTKRLIRWLAPGLFLLLALACTTEQPADPFQPPEPTTGPNIAATVTARDRALPQGGPLPTMVPPLVIQATQDFAAAHGALSLEWDQLHQDLARWRQGLTFCDESSMRVAFLGFSSDFNSVAQAAGGLSRHYTVRSMSDQLIEAARKEESALRRLLDSRQSGQSSGPIPQPEAQSSLAGDPGAAGPSAGQADKGPGNEEPYPALETGYEDLALARYGALDLRKGVADQLKDLERRTSVASQRRVGTFLTAFDSLSVQWDQFHEDYDSLRAAQPTLTSAETLDGLNLLVEQHRQVLLAHRALPADPATQPVSDILADAVQKEDSALRRLRSAFQQSEDGANDKSPISSGDVAGSSPTEGMEHANGGEAMEDTPAPALSTGGSPSERVSIGTDPLGMFDTFEEQMAPTGEARRAARLNLDLVVAETSAANRAAVADFTIGYNSLLEQWMGFHRDYDAWLATEGGCDRAAVTSALGDFALRIGEIALSARQLPRATSLRPLGELTVEAAQREEEALKRLRDGWRPFAASVYEDLDSELGASGKLRRQVDLGIQELLERYAVSGS